ncbi:MAG: hypothetical protein ACOCUD_04580 [Bacillota bacterium]
MIGNKYLRNLFAYEDEDLALSQLLEMLKFDDEDFVNSLHSFLDIGLCNKEETVFLTKVAAITDYCLQLKSKEVPSWLRDSRLEFDSPYYHSKRISDFEKFRLQYSVPAPFRNRNVYFDLDSLIRV